MSKDAVLSVRLSDDAMENLRRLADFNGCTVSAYVRHVITMTLNNKRSWVNFVCEDCKNGVHDRCQGSDHCDCQHRPPR